MSNLEAAAGSDGGGTGGALGDGQDGVLGALGAPHEDGGTAGADKEAEHGLAAAQALGGVLEELGLHAGVTLLVLLAVHVPGAEGVLEVLQEKAEGKANQLSRIATGKHNSWSSCCPGHVDNRKTNNRQMNNRGHNRGQLTSRSKYLEFSPYLARVTTALHRQRGRHRHESSQHTCETQ